MTEETQKEKEPKNIHEAIIAVMEQVGYVQKKKTTSAGMKYSFAGEAALIEALRPWMVRYGIYQSVVEIKQTIRNEYQTSSGTTMQNTVIHGKVRFFHAPTGTFQDVEAIGEGSDVGDKSAPKAMTGMFKYTLRETFLIETGDDPDKDQNQEPRKPKKQEGSSFNVDENLTPVNDVAWDMWNSLTQKADELNVPYNAINRDGVNTGQLRKRYRDLQDAVVAAKNKTEEEKK